MRFAQNPEMTLEQRLDRLERAFERLSDDVDLSVNYARATAVAVVSAERLAKLEAQYHARDRDPEPS